MQGLETQGMAGLTLVLPGICEQVQSQYDIEADDVARLPFTSQDTEKRTDPCARPPKRPRPWLCKERSTRVQRASQVGSSRASLMSVQPYNRLKMQTLQIASAELAG